MKRTAPLLLAVAPLLLPTTPALGQTTIALTGGRNHASLAVERRGEDASPRSTRGYAFGVNATIPLASRLGLQLGVSYSEKGGSRRARGTEVNSQSAHSSAALELDYLEFTVLGKTQILASDGGLEVYLLAGPAVALEASCRWNQEATVGGQSSSSRADCLEDSTSSYDFGVAGGGLLEMWVSDRLGLLLGALYTLGLPDIDVWTDEYTMKTRTLSFTAGAVFAIN